MQKLLKNKILWSISALILFITVVYCLISLNNQLDQRQDDYARFDEKVITLETNVSNVKNELESVNVRNKEIEEQVKSVSQNLDQIKKEQKDLDNRYQQDQEFLIKLQEIVFISN